MFIDEPPLSLGQALGQDQYDPPLAYADPGLRVVSREFSEELGGCLVIETSQAGVIVVGDEGVEVGVAFGVVAKAAMHRRSAAADRRRWWLRQPRQSRRRQGPWRH